MTILAKVPGGATRMQGPIGGTLILLMLPDHFTKAPAWVWPVCWTLWVFIWLVFVYHVVRVVNADSPTISDAKWREVFRERN